MPENGEKNTTCANLVQTPRPDEESSGQSVVTNSACNVRIFRVFRDAGRDGKSDHPRDVIMNLSVRDFHDAVGVTKMGLSDLPFFGVIKKDGSRMVMHSARFPFFLSSGLTLQVEVRCSQDG